MMHLNSVRHVKANGVQRRRHNKYWRKILGVEQFAIRLMEAAVITIKQQEYQEC